MALWVDVGFIGPHTSDDRLSPFPAVCVGRRCGRVVVFPLMHALQVMLELLSLRPRGSGGRSPLRDIIANVLGWAFPILRCHSCSCCCAALCLAFAFSWSRCRSECGNFFGGPRGGFRVVLVDGVGFGAVRVIFGCFVFVS